jgi:hypothetical protein
VVEDGRPAEDPLERVGVLGHAALERLGQRRQPLLAGQVLGNVDPDDVVLEPLDTLATVVALWEDLVQRLQELEHCRYGKLAVSHRADNLHAGDLH